MIVPFQGSTPKIDPTVRLAQSSTIVGAVTIESEVNIWYGAIIRGDENAITIGSQSNVQDQSVIHCEN